MRWPFLALALGGSALMITAAVTDRWWKTDLASMRMKGHLGMVEAEACNEDGCQSMPYTRMFPGGDEPTAFVYLGRFGFCDALATGMVVLAGALLPLFGKSAKRGRLAPVRVAAALALVGIGVGAAFLAKVPGWFTPTIDFGGPLYFGGALLVIVAARGARTAPA